MGPRSSHRIFNWSSGGNMAYEVPREERQKLDLRLQRTHMEFEQITTRDGMSFEIGCDVFWQIIHVPTMMRNTFHPPKSIWTRLKTVFSEAVAQLNFNYFLANSRSILEEKDEAEVYDREGFYRSLGLALVNVDNTAICLRVLRYAS